MQYVRSNSQSKSVNPRYRQLSRHIVPLLGIGFIVLALGAVNQAKGGYCSKNVGGEQTTVEILPDCDLCKKDDCKKSCEAEGGTWIPAVVDDEGTVVEDPVAFPSGAYAEFRKDATVKQFGSPINAVRHTSTNHTFPNSGLGDEWDTSLRQRVVENGDNSATVYLGYKSPATYAKTGDTYGRDYAFAVTKVDNKFRLDYDNGAKIYFNDSNNVVSRTYRTGVYFDYVYDGSQNLRTVRAKGTPIMEVLWDNSPSRITKINNLRCGEAIEYSYDGSSRLTKVVGGCRSCGGVASEGQCYTYVASGNGVGKIEEVRDLRDKRQLKMAYDSSDRVLTQFKNVDTKKALFDYSGYATGLYESTSFVGVNLKIRLDTSGRVTKNSRWSGGIQKCIFEKIYDGSGNIITQQWAMKTVSETTTYRKQAFTYATGGSGANRVASKSVYRGGVWKVKNNRLIDYGYGNSTRHVYPNNITKNTTYTNDGLPLTRQWCNPTLCDPIPETYDYDNNGQVLTRKSKRGTITSNNYDANGYILTRITDPGGLNITRISFPDSAGNITKEVDPNSNIFSTYYDCSTITKTIDPSGLTTDYYYDEAGNLITQKQYGSGGSITRVTVNIYDDLSLLVTKRRQITATPTYDDTLYEYDDADRLTYTETSDGVKQGTIYNHNDKPEFDLAYDGSSWITKTEYYYDMAGNITSQKDANGNYVFKSREYDETNRLTKDVDGLDNYVIYEYDDNDNITRETSYDSGDTAVAETHMYYDHLDNVTRIRQLASPGSADTTNDILADMDYDAESNIITSTKYLAGTEGSSPTTNQEILTYDNADRLITKSTSDGPTIAFSYDQAGNLLTKKVDPAGLAVTSIFAYDANGRQITAKNPDSTYAVTLYDKFGEMTQAEVYDSANNAKAASGSMYDYSLGVTTKSYRINDPGTSLAYNSANDPATQYQYTSAGRLTRIVDPNSNNSATFDYDDLGRKITITDAVTNKIVFEYDNADRPMTLVSLDYDGAAHVTFKSASEFDAVNRVTKMIQQGPDGDITATTDNLETIVYFDALGRQTLIQDPKGTQIASLYDGLGRLTRKTEDSAGIARYTDYNYDRASRLTRQTGYTADATGAQNTDYAYNKAGVMTKATYPDNDGDVTFIYDAALRLITKNDQENQDTISVYDSMSRPTSVTRGSEIDTFTYSALGRITLAQRGISGDPDDVSEVKRYYDGLGRLTREAQAVKETTALNVDYLYDKVGSITALYYPGGSLTISRTMTANNLANIISRNGTQLADYNYVSGRVKSLTYETGNDDVSATRLYDGVARLTRLTWAQAGNTLPDFSYTFDKASNILTKTHEHRSGDPIEKYDVDGLYRLTDARYDFRTVTHGFDYDDLGNQLTFTVDGSATAALYNDVNELISYGGTPVYYDKNGNLTKDAAAGNGPYSYYYDMRNQLTKVTKSGGDVAEYAYDALGRRIQFIDSVNTVTKRFYHDDARVIEEYDAGANRQRYYVWGNYIDELLMMNNDAGDDSDYNVCHDQLYSAHGLLSKADGAIVERYDYDAYGQPVIYTEDGNDDTWFTSDDTTASVSAKGLPYLFTGREFGPLDGADSNYLKLQYSRARYYNYDLRRWMQREPLGYVDGMSLYEYVGSDPIGYVDFSGAERRRVSSKPTSKPKTPREIERDLWEKQRKHAESAFKFWAKFLDLRMGPKNRDRLSAKCKKRLMCIIRAVSYVESVHGSGSGSERFPKRDPMQTGNPKDKWWRELTGPPGRGSRFIRGYDYPVNYYAPDLLAAVKDYIRRLKLKDPKTSYDLNVLNNLLEGHKNKKFNPGMSYFWGTPYLLHRINTQGKDPGRRTFKCGDCSVKRLLKGAGQYNAGKNLKEYERRIKKAVKMIGCMK